LLFAEPHLAQAIHHIGLRGKLFDANHRTGFALRERTRSGPVATVIRVGLGRRWMRLIQRGQVKRGGMGLQGWI
jgi:hypothetical protein